MIFRPLYRAYISTVLLVCLFVGGVSAEAQFSVGGFGGGPQLEVNPLYPAPNQKFTVRYADYSIGDGIASAYWYVNGELASDEPSPSIELSAPELGTPIEIEARVREGSAPVRTATRTIVPATVDFIIEADTSAPYFYKGRRVPGPGSSAHITAIPFLYAPDGARLNATQLRYQWSINNEVRREGVGQTTFRVPDTLFGGTAVTLSIESADGTVTYETFVGIPETTPTLRFYEHNPLSGLSRNALPSYVHFAEDEAVIRAEPYGISNDSYAHAEYGWVLDGNPVPTTGNPQILSLRKSGEGGRSEVGFAIRNMKALAQYAQGLLTIEF
jgi:hypothetical protein